MRTRARRPRYLIVEDVMADGQFLPYQQIMRRAGVRAVQSTALVSTNGALIGVLSTHFPACHRPSDVQMRGTRDAAQAAANAIIRLRARANTSASNRVETSLRLLRKSRDALARSDKLN